MTDQDLGDINDFVELAQDLAEGAGNLANNLPGVRSAYRAFCRVAAGTPGGAFLGVANIRNVCTPYLEPDGRGFGSEEPLPFGGGQCDALYQITADYTLRRDGVVVGNNVLTGQGMGPLSFSVEVIRVSSTVLRREGRYLDRDGDPINQYIIKEEQTLAGGAVRVTTGEISNLSISRVDGQPDNCGNENPYFRPGDGYEGEEFGDPQLIEGPDGVTRPITVSPPEIGPDGGLSLEVQIDDLTIDLGGGDDGGGGGVLTPGPTEVGPGIGSDGGQGAQDVPTPPEGTRCVAIAIVTQGAPARAGSVDSSAPPVRTYGALGNVALRLATDEGFSYWGSDTVIFQTMTLKAIPVEGLAIEQWRLTLQPGMTATVKPIYRADS